MEGRLYVYWAGTRFLFFPSFFLLRQPPERWRDRRGTGARWFQFFFSFFPFFFFSFSPLSSVFRPFSLCKPSAAELQRRVPCSFFFFFPAAFLSNPARRLSSRQISSNVPDRNQSFPFFFSFFFPPLFPPYFPFFGHFSSFAPLAHPSYVGMQACRGSRDHLVPPSRPFLSLFLFPLSCPTRQPIFSLPLNSIDEL